MKIKPLIINRLKKNKNSISCIIYSVILIWHDIPTCRTYPHDMHAQTHNMFTHIKQAHPHIQYEPKHFQPPLLVPIELSENQWIYVVSFNFYLIIIVCLIAIIQEIILEQYVYLLKSTITVHVDTRVTPSTRITTLHSKECCVASVMWGSRDWYTPAVVTN